MPRFSNALFYCTCNAHDEPPIHNPGLTIASLTIWRRSIFSTKKTWPRFEVYFMYLEVFLLMTNELRLMLKIYPCASTKN